VRVKHTSIRPTLVIWLAPLMASAFKGLGQYASSPGNRAYCYTELAISSLAVAETIVSSHYTYPWLSRSGWLVKCQDGIPVNGHWLHI